MQKLVAIAEAATSSIISTIVVDIIEAGVCHGGVWKKYALTMGLPKPNLCG